VGDGGPAGDDVIREPVVSTGANVTGAAVVLPTGAVVSGAAVTGATVLLMLTTGAMVIGAAVVGAVVVPTTGAVVAGAEVVALSPVVPTTVQPQDRSRTRNHVFLRLYSKSRLLHIVPPLHCNWSRRLEHAHRTE
jgi:hypothetical protein